MIDVTCFSEKADVSIGFGFEPDGEYATEAHSTIDDLISEGAADAFWENYDEFTPGIEKAKQLLNDEAFPSFREALFEVFEHFAFSFENDGKPVKLACEVDRFFIRTESARGRIQAYYSGNAGQS